MKSSRTQAPSWFPATTTEARLQSAFRRHAAAYLFAMILAAVVFPASAVAGTAEEGKEIATRWCSSCHNVGTGDRPAASDGVPTFDSIARRDNFNRVQLEAWIGNPHPPMPNFNLSRDEIESLVSYIESLRPKR
ncbi:MAG: cytochrome c [Pseudomonadota bacterium]